MIGGGSCGISGLDDLVLGLLRKFELLGVVEMSSSQVPGHLLVRPGNP